MPQSPQPHHLTRLVKDLRTKIKKTLEPDVNIVEKVVILRKLARAITKEYASDLNYRSLEDFRKDYDRGRSPLVELEGPGISYGDTVIIKKCPMAPLFEYFMVNGKFPLYWTNLPGAFMEKFKQDVILHPLCIIHQTSRNLLVSKIPKGKGVVHSITIACRSGTGKVVYSEFGLSIADKTKKKIDTLIEGFACAFYVR